MQAEVEFDGKSIECKLTYPYSERPIAISGPLGSQVWQSTDYSKSNCKMILDLCESLPNEFVIKIQNKAHKATLNRQRGSDVWCTI
ncbi:hypothetical protein [Methylovulum psychrotolerans]|uniref:Uncharacterized protein n=1 Tax=Methylovulum psychrotolerans TaxID=1704499 RepID=A0A2S5CR46_9GAMM|nr:hypothetical protein [Methylovulum psychrotolerans]POZ53217.1 hypothetical protein AADEFJLK_00235 [Methylovulum psychrotolerans]